MTPLAPVVREYRALLMFDTLPAGCIPFLCSDEHSAPHIRPGEFVVVDTTDRTPRHLELYVIQWECGRRVICQARNTGRKLIEVPEADAWSVGSLNAIRGRAAVDAYLRASDLEPRDAGQVPVLRRLGWSDGWFSSDHLAGKLVGCVVGLYAPDFEGPKRSA